MEVTHSKGGNVVWTCVDDNIIEDQNKNREIRLHMLDYILFEEN